MWFYANQTNKSKLKVKIRVMIPLQMYIYLKHTLGTFYQTHNKIRSNLSLQIIVETYDEF